MSTQEKIFVFNFVIADTIVFSELNFNFVFHFWLYQVFIAAQAFSLVAEREGPSLAVVLRLLITAASLVAEHRLQGAKASVVKAHGLNSCSSQALEHRINSWGARAQLLFSMWSLPESGNKPVSPALPGRFLITELPGKPTTVFLILKT